MKGIGQWVTKRAQLSHGKAALIFNNHKFTYEQFNSRINRLANGLVQIGVRKKDRVAAFLMNGNEILETMFACAKIGAIFVPINFRLSLEEVEYILNDSGAAVFIYQSEFVLLASKIRNRVSVSCWIGVGNPVSNDDIKYEDFLLKHSDQELGVDIQAEEVHMIMYTSGTTGRPKGAMLTHANTFWNITQILIAQPILETDVTLTVAPLFHSGALTILTLTLLYKGGTVIISNKFEPTQVLQTIQKEKVTCMFMVPSMWRAVMQVPGFYQYSLVSLRFGISAGAACPLIIIEIFKSRNVPLIQGFGLSEVAPVAILGIQDCMRKIGSVGKAAFYVDIKIINENGREASVKEVGELAVHAPNVMSGYWQKPEATRNALKNGWFLTGDCVWKDEEGYIYVAGRKKDVIITGGENVYPIEVEQVLDRHPNIAENTVIGIPDAKWGEVIKAIIVLKDSSQQLSVNGIKAFCEDKLARYKVPKILEFVSSLPRNAAGKVLKNCLH